MINVLHRDSSKKTKFVRDKGFIPAVIYGRQLEKSIPIEIYKTDFKRFLENNPSNRFVDLSLDGDVKKCLITDVQIDSVRDYFLHIDLRLVE